MKQYRQDAVSPVVGVMLMLVVVIIIAAIVSGFAGGLIGSNTQNAPTLSMDVKVVNTGGWSGSGFFATVTGVSAPIRTKDLKLVTSWTAANGTMPVSGGNTVVASGSSNINALFVPGKMPAGTYVAPFGNGPGVNATRGISSGPTYLEYSEPHQQFGNYSLVSGTALSAFPCGAEDGDNIGNSSASAGAGYGISTSYQYSPGMTGTYTDAATAVLGTNWQLLRAGDKVNVRVIYIPTGSIIFNKNVPVMEG